MCANLGIIIATLSFSVEDSRTASLVVGTAGSLRFDIDCVRQILVGWTNISAEGITTSGTGIDLGSYNIATERCKLVSNETPLVCKDGNFLFTLP